VLHVLIPRKALKQLRGIPTHLHKNIFDHLEELRQHDHPLHHQNVEKIRDTKNEYRMRIGDYRIRFTLRDHEVLVTHLRHRKDAYKQ
jgi:mRNA interferase RelE/StbE